METIFDKPLDKQVASNTQAIANKIRSNGGSTCNAKIYETTVTFNDGEASISGSTIKAACGMSAIAGIFGQIATGNSGFISRASVIDANSTIYVRGLTNNGGVLSGDVACVFLVVGTPA